MRHQTKPGPSQRAGTPSKSTGVARLPPLQLTGKRRPGPKECSARAITAVMQGKRSNMGSLLARYTNLHHQQQYTGKQRGGSPCP
eukprot:6806421-Alexandrium_andersonii.AAC.1